MSTGETTRQGAADPKCGDIKRGNIDLRCERQQGHADGYEPGSGDESKWHMAKFERHETATYYGSRHELDATETVWWEPVDHAAEAVRHMMAGRRRDS